MSTHPFPPRPCPPQPPTPPKPQPDPDENKLCQDTVDIQARTIRYLLSNYEALLRKVEREGLKGPVIISEDEPEKKAEGDLWFDGENLHVFADGEWHPVQEDVDEFKIEWSIGEERRFNYHETIPTGWWMMAEGMGGGVIDFDNHQGSHNNGNPGPGVAFFAHGNTRVTQEVTLRPIKSKIVRNGEDDNGETTVAV